MTAVTTSKVLTSVFNITKHNIQFTICTPRYWEDSETFKKLNETTEQWKSNQIILHLEEVNKKRLEMK